jgi:hypothetical protein
MPIIEASTPHMLFAAQHERSMKPPNDGGAGQLGAAAGGGSHTAPFMVPH